MGVYVDDMYLTTMGHFGRMKMSHMIADSREELDAMADLIGVARRWIQCPGTHREHYDVAIAARTKAIAAGAIPITMYELATMTRQRRNRRADTGGWCG